MDIKKYYELAKKIAKEKGLIPTEYLILPSGIVFTLSQNVNEVEYGAVQIKIRPNMSWEWFDINLNIEEFVDSGNSFVTINDGQ